MANNSASFSDNLNSHSIRLLLLLQYSRSRVCLLTGITYWNQVPIVCHRAKIHWKLNLLFLLNQGREWFNVPLRGCRVWVDSAHADRFNLPINLLSILRQTIFAGVGVDISATTLDVKLLFKFNLTTEYIWWVKIHVPFFLGVFSLSGIVVDVHRTCACVTLFINLFIVWLWVVRVNCGILQDVGTASHSAHIRGDLRNCLECATSLENFIAPIFIFLSVTDWSIERNKRWSSLWVLINTFLDLHSNLDARLLWKPPFLLHLRNLARSSSSTHNVWLLWFAMRINSFQRTFYKRLCFLNLSNTSYLYYSALHPIHHGFSCKFFICSCLHKSKRICHSLVLC